MAKTVDEIMNRELFSLRNADPIEEALGYLLTLGISSAPVIDPYGRPVGFLSIRDTLVKKQGGSVADRMTRPALSIRADWTIDQAAQIMAEHDLHHAAVVDRDGVAVGMLSLVDVIKALRGLPVAHPDAFPRYDKDTGLTWTADTILDLEHADVAPDGAGILVLISAPRGQKEGIVWSEACNNVRTRVYEMLSIPQDDMPALARVLADMNLRFRAALVPDSEARNRALRGLLEETSRFQPSSAAMSVH